MWGIYSQCAPEMALLVTLFNPVRIKLFVLICLAQFQNKMLYLQMQPHFLNDLMERCSRELWGSHVQNCKNNLMLQYSTRIYCLLMTAKVCNYDWMELRIAPINISARNSLCTVALHFSLAQCVSQKARDGKHKIQYHPAPDTCSGCDWILFYAWQWQQKCFVNRCPIFP